jgi:hypothetical protein
MGSSARSHRFGNVIDVALARNSLELLHFQDKVNDLLHGL